MSRWWRTKHALKYWEYRPKWVIWRFKERRLTVKRGYSTFVLDEFDHHFNKMAVASLRYHLSPECVCNNEAQRPAYEDLIARLSEPGPSSSDNPEERAVLNLAFQFPLNDHESPESRALLDRFQEREDAWEQRQLKARHDFVDIMPGLWS